MTWISPVDVKPDKVYNLNNVKINEYLLGMHNINGISLPGKRTKKFKGVVIHNTDPAKSADDGRQYTAATLNNNVSTRTHYYVTYESAWKNLPDESMNWSCGDGTTGEGNNGCISLEIIMGSKNGNSDLQARDNGAKLAAYILFKNNMTVNDMYTHNYFLNIRNGVTGDYNKLCTSPTPTRNCPYYIVWDWENFRKQVDAYIVKLGGKSVYNNPTPAPKPTNTVSKDIYIATSHAAIREEPSKLSKIITRVTKGDYYPATEVKNNWINHLTGGYSILKDGGILFVKNGEYETKTTTTKVNVRKAPTTKSDIIIVLNPGVEVAAFKGGTVRNEGYIWNKIVINNKLGYIAGEYLK